MLLTGPIPSPGSEPTDRNHPSGLPVSFGLGTIGKQVIFRLTRLSFLRIGRIGGPAKRGGARPCGLSNQHLAEKLPNILQAPSQEVPPPSIADAVPMYQVGTAKGGFPPLSFSVDVVTVMK